MSRNGCKTAYDQQQATIYDSERFSTRSGLKIHEMEINNLKAAIHTALTDKSNLRILEVGCGTGRLLVEMTKSGFKVDGVDASHDMLSQCVKKIEVHSPDTKLSIGEAARIPYPDNSYDFVYCIRLLNQTESSEYALNVVSDMIRVAKPDGYILVEFVNVFRPRIGRGKYKGVRLRPEDVIEHACNNGTKLIWFRGVFFLGMTALNVAPDFLVGFVSIVDNFLSRLFPKLCSRCYVFFRKEIK